MQLWCEVEASSQRTVTRQQAGIKAVEELQSIWRRLKRDDKVSYGFELRLQCIL
jgi:hypothetical protein